MCLLPSATRWLFIKATSLLFLFSLLLSLFLFFDNTIFVLVNVGWLYSLLPALISLINPIKPLFPTKNPSDFGEGGGREGEESGEGGEGWGRGGEGRGERGGGGERRGRGEEREGRGRGQGGESLSLLMNMS
jgi:hypothetical protein